MPRFLANLSMLFTEQPFLERFAAARRAGFDTVEVQFPYEHSVEDIRHALKDARVSLYLINLPAGDWAGGERGIAVDPGRVEEFREGVEQAIDYARAFGVRRLNCIVGRRQAELSEAEQWAVLTENLRHAGKRLQSELDATLLVEPVNRYDIPGFFLGSSAEALRALDLAGIPNSALQYDVYHMQRSEGELVNTLRTHLARIGHIQIADNPGRHQPGTGEINFPFLLGELDRMGYDGFVSLEYVPTPDTERSLSWLKEWGA